MACYFPLRGYQCREENENGKFPIRFNKPEGDYKIISVACGRCVGCRADIARSWAVRCIHEAQFYSKNSFITLTYKTLPKNGSLVKKDLQDFWKRLRKKIGIKIRYFACGEYGENFARPHYHACVFGYDFPDRQTLYNSKLYISAELMSLWSAGYSTVGDCTFSSARYVAGYVAKKLGGELAASHYGPRIPEFAAMSRRPGLGSAWCHKYATDVYTSDCVILPGGVRSGAPKYYDKIILDKNKNNNINIDMDTIKLNRVKKARSNPHNTPYRLLERYNVAKARAQSAERSFENGV